MITNHLYLEKMNKEQRTIYNIGHRKRQHKCMNSCIQPRRWCIMVFINNIEQWPVYTPRFIATIKLENSTQTSRRINKRGRTNMVAHKHAENNEPQ